LREGIRSSKKGKSVGEVNGFVLRGKLGPRGRAEESFIALCRQIHGFEFEKELDTLLETHGDNFEQLTTVIYSRAQNLAQQFLQEIELWQLSESVESEFLTALRMIRSIVNKELQKIKSHDLRSSYMYAAGGFALLSGVFYVMMAQLTDRMRNERYKALKGLTVLPFGYAMYQALNAHRAYSEPLQQRAWFYELILGLIDRSEVELKNIIENKRALLEHQLEEHLDDSDVTN